MGKRGAVYHVRLAEDLHDGRLHRSTGDTLCGDRSKWGDLFSVEDRDRDLGSAVVTCKSCLRIAARWQP